MDVKYQRDTQRFDFIGLDLNRPVDSVKPGKLPYALNIRSYLAGRIEPRDGLINLTGIPALPGAAPPGPALVMNSSCPVIPSYGVLIGIPYSFTPSASGGVPPYTWSLFSGSLPTGLVINSATGAITGTPTVAGTYNFVLQVVDSIGQRQTTSGCSITVSGSLIARPTYVEAFMDNPPVNPIRSRIINAANAADLDDVTTFAQCQFDASSSLTPDYANLQLSGFRPLPPVVPTSMIVHAIVEYHDSPSGPGPHHFTDIMNARNIFVLGAGAGDNQLHVVDPDSNDGSGPFGHDLARVDKTYTFNTANDGSNWWLAKFTSNADNIWVRCYNTDTLNYTLATHAVYNIYGVYVEYFF